jgi:2-(1,2-epoxy-1,2-dihydrophenyl)acetyl-CoA isomerase
MSTGSGKASGQGLRVEVADGIATITLDRPEALNALTVEVKEALLAAFRSVARDRAVRAVVLTGTGRAFCAGQDLKERLEPDAAPLAVELRERYNPIIRQMRTLDQPIVGAINGVAAGAGGLMSALIVKRSLVKRFQFMSKSTTPSSCCRLLGAIFI